MIFLREGDQEEFAGDLRLARAVCHKCPHLDEAEQLPERFDNRCEHLINDDCMKPDYEADLKKQIAAAWIIGGVAEPYDGFVIFAWSATEREKTGHLKPEAIRAFID